MRIFIGLNNIAGYYGPLVMGLRELGHNVDEVYSYKNKFSYRESVSGDLISKVYHLLGNHRMAYSTKFHPMKILYRILQDIWRLPLFLRALFCYDAYIFSFGASIIYFDLYIYRLFGKKVIMVYHGSDNRPPFTDGCQIQRFGKKITKQWKKIIRRYARNTQRVERLVTAVVCLPASGCFLKKAAYSFLAIGIPTKATDTIEFPEYVKGITRILHSPSNPDAKGTPLVREIMGELKEEGLLFEYIEITGVPNARVLEEIKKCHFVVDQAYSDTPLAGFAAEAASFGRVAVVGSYNCAESLATHSGGIHPPSVFVHPSALKDSIRKLIQNPSETKRLGEHAQKFIRDRWDYLTVAKRFERLLLGKGDKSWMFDPSLICSSGIAASPEKIFKELISGLVDRYGESCLMADHNLAWKKNLLKLAGKSNI